MKESICLVKRMDIDYQRVDIHTSINFMDFLGAPKAQVASGSPSWDTRRYYRVEGTVSQTFHLRLSICLIFQKVSNSYPIFEKKI